MDKPKPAASSSTPDKKTNNWLVYSGMVFEMFAVIGIFAVLGYFLDKKLDTNPVLVIVFLIIGLAVAFYRIFKQIS